MALISTTDAALQLKFSVRRVQELIKEGRLSAKKLGRDYFIDPKDLALVKTVSLAGQRKHDKLLLN